MTHRILRLTGAGLIIAAAFAVSGCAKHADFVELRDHLATVSKSQEQDQKRLDALQRRMESLERVKDVEPTKPKIDDLTVRMQKLESRLSKLEETTVASAVPRLEPAATTDSQRGGKPQSRGGLKGRLSQMCPPSLRHLLLISPITTILTASTIWRWQGSNVSSRTSLGHR